MELGCHTLAMLVNITPETEDKLGVLVQLHPTGRDNFLPPNVKLRLLSEAGNNLKEVTSRIQDNYIQINYFKGKIGIDSFSIEVSLDDLKIREDFQL